MGNAQTFTDQNFESEVLGSSIPVLVDFTASWCAPCQRLAPVIEELAAEYAGKVKVGKLDIDENGEIPVRYGIMSVPTVILFHHGAPVDTIMSLNTKSFYRSRLDALVKGAL